MRSTVFVILSVIIHSLCVAAMVLAPIRMAEKAGTSDIEVTVEEVADQLGAPEAAEVVKAEPRKVEPKKVKAKKAVTPVAATELPPKEKIVETTQETIPEALDPQIEAKVEDESPNTDDLQLKPVKESIDGDDTTEAQSNDGQPQDPAPVAMIKDDPTSDGEPLGKGGATEAGAVQYTNLKQFSGNQPPVYPLEARRQHREGQVELVYEVARDGSVRNIKISQSSGHEDLDQAAVKAISKYKFVAGQDGWAKHPVVFSLRGQIESLPSRLRTMGAQGE